MRVCVLGGDCGRMYVRTYMRIEVFFCSLSRFSRSFVQTGFRSEECQADCGPEKNQMSWNQWEFALDPTQVRHTDCVTVTVALRCELRPYRYSMSDDFRVLGVAYAAQPHHRFTARQFFRETPITCAVPIFVAWRPMAVDASKLSFPRQTRLSNKNILGGFRSWLPPPVKWPLFSPRR